MLAYYNMVPIYSVWFQLDVILFVSASLEIACGYGKVLWNYEDLIITKRKSFCNQKQNKGIINNKVYFSHLWSFCTCNTISLMYTRIFDLCVQNLLVIDTHNVFYRNLRSLCLPLILDTCKLKTSAYIFL